MDGVASAFAVVSLALQLIEGVQKLSDFWRSVEAAPANVQTIVSDLDLLSLTLHDIEFEAQHGQPDPTLEKVLRHCEVNVKTLSSALQELEPGFASTRRRTRKWTALKSVLRWDKLKQSQDILSRLKTTLILVLQNMQRSLPHSQAGLCNMRC